MDQKPFESKARYRIIGISSDGSSTTVRGSMTWVEATKAKAATNKSGDFASVHIEPDLPTQHPAPDHPEAP